MKPISPFYYASEKLGSDVKHSRRIDATRDPTTHQTAFENHICDAMHPCPGTTFPCFTSCWHLPWKVGSLHSEATVKGKEEPERQQRWGTSTASNYL